MPAIRLARIARMPAASARISTCVAEPTIWRLAGMSSLDNAASSCGSLLLARSTMVTAAPGASTRNFPGSMKSIFIVAALPLGNSIDHARVYQYLGCRNDGQVLTQGDIP